MRCPVCDHVDLLMTERQGVEIDYCPKCRGAWLDRGELDEIVARSAGQPVASQRHAYAEDHHDDDQRHDGEYGADKPRSKKKGGLLGDILGGFGG
ncbi:MAG TPA: zf-TFIIB domain-containing protein [Thermoleophilia bacterium]